MLGYRLKRVLLSSSGRLSIIFLFGGFLILPLVMPPVPMELGKSFPKTSVGVNVIVTTKPFKVAPFLTDWVNYKQIKQAMMGLLATEKLHCPQK